MVEVQIPQKAINHIVDKKHMPRSEATIDCLYYPKVLLFYPTQRRPDSDKAEIYSAEFQELNKEIIFSMS